jgi:hypothetical protein
MRLSFLRCSSASIGLALTPTIFTAAFGCSAVLKLLGPVLNLLGFMDVDKTRLGTGFWFRHQPWRSAITSHGSLPNVQPSEAAQC